MKKTVELLKKNDNILILAHQHPDGDTLGSSFALCRALRSLGKKAQVRCSSVVNRRYDYLREGLEEQVFEPELVVAVDVADKVLLGADIEREYGNRVDLCIDHHSTNKRFAAHSFVNGESASCAEIAAEVIEQLGVEIDKKMADCIYTGISTDTGCFRYTNTTALTHRHAADMMEKGANAEYINRIMFETRTAEYITLERLVLQSITMHFDNRCALMLITQDMFTKSGAGEDDCDAICAISRQIEGVLVGATLRERADGTYKASIRTHAPVDASKICARLGGGGHRRAAGCQFDGSLEQATQQLLACIEEELKLI